MKYKVTKTDIFLGGQIIPEESIIDSAKYTEEEIESVKHLLVLVDNTTPITIEPVTNAETKTDSTTSNIAETSKPKRSRKPKQ